MRITIENLIGQLLSCIVIQAIISEVLMLKGVDFGSAAWWTIIIGGGLIYNVGTSLRQTK